MIPFDLIVHHVLPFLWAKEVYTGIVQAIPELEIWVEPMCHHIQPHGKITDVTMTRTILQGVPRYGLLDTTISWLLEHHLPNVIVYCREGMLHDPSPKLGAIELETTTVSRRWVSFTSGVPISMNHKSLSGRFRVYEIHSTPWGY